MRSTATILFLSLLTFSSLVFAQKKKKTTEEPYVLELGSHKVTAEEFKYVYSKNNNNSAGAFSDTSIKSYLNLYTKFKLKVLEAKEMGLDTSNSFKEELETYRKQLARPYLTENSVIDSLMKEAYERKKEEVRASHILVLVDENATPADTMAALKKIQTAFNRIKDGENFESVAKEVSEDKYSAVNGGDLGFFTSLTMVYPFEQAAYNTQIGKISPIFRTRFGYHFLKVTGKRPSPGKVKVAHIMLRANPGMPAEDSTDVKKRIDEVYEQLTKGADWNTMVTNYTEDPESKPRGGMLPVFGTNDINIPSFVEAAFSMQNKGEFTKPVLTPYGWHIIRLEEKLPLEDYKTLESKLKQQVERDTRSQIKDKVFYERLKKTNNFKENTKNYQKMVSLADTSVNSDVWKVNEKAQKLVLFTIQNNPYTVNDFYEYASKVNSPTKPGRKKEETIKLKYTDFVNTSLRTYEEAHLAEKYLDYKMLYREYREGILLFQLMDEKVWSKAAKDTAGLEKFFQGIKGKYRWEDRANCVIINAKDEQLRKLAFEKLKELETRGKVELSHPSSQGLAFKLKSTETDVEKHTAELERVVKNLTSDTTLLLAIKGYYKKGEPKTAGKARIEKIVSYLTEKGVNKNRIETIDGGLQNTKSVNQIDFVYYGTRIVHIERSINETSGSALNVKIETGLFEKKDKPYFKGGEVSFANGYYEVKQDDRFLGVNIKNIEPARDKELKEVKGLVISEYQAQLEKEWLQSLEKKFPVKVNEEELKKLVKK